MSGPVTWATSNGWSGPRIRGTHLWVPPAKPDAFDVAVAAIAEPEGPRYDKVYSCDGTGTTFGFLQWTLTSGRLQRLLSRTSALCGGAFRTRFSGPLFDTTGIYCDPHLGTMSRGGGVLASKADIRAAFTPPAGRCPKSGPDWITAQVVARLFSGLGEIPLAQRAQREFVESEIAQAIGQKRPAMGGKRIADWLYPHGWERDADSDDLAAARALFWSMWWNGPRKAEEYLSALPRLPSAEAIGRKFGLSRYARWGVRQVTAPSRSRYEKSARVINRMLGAVVLPELWR